MNWFREKIKSRPGLNLAAMLRRAEPSPEGGAESGADGVPLVIVCHGFTGSKEGGGGAVAMADGLAGRGFDTLLFDFTGCGESGGLWEEITLSRQVEDLGAAVRWARERGYERIILNGRSFGGATVLAYAAGDRQIAAVCTWAAVARPRQLFSGFAEMDTERHGPAGGKILLNDGSGSLCLQRQFFEDLQSYDLAGCAARISPRPLLLIHGSADEVVPVAAAQLLFDAAGEPKQLALIEGADHRFSDHRKQVWELFFNWLERDSGCIPKG
ncbi:MAG: alpha/beta hydrolase [Firmicutes bacterium]|nr:alpha/beta hydrolase [Bacillota bacterium]